MARLLCRSETIVDDWHPLDGVPAPEFVPSEWNGPHVGTRFADAWRTLLALPGDGKSRQAGIWPTYASEWNELMARCGAEVQVLAVEGKLDAGFGAAYGEWLNNQNRTRELPSARAISEFDRALGWLRYLRGYDNLPLAFNLSGWARGAGLTLGELLRSQKRYRRLDENVLQGRNWQACDLIADGLNRDEVAPW